MLLVATLCRHDRLLYYHLPLYTIHIMCGVNPIYVHLSCKKTMPIHLLLKKIFSASTHNIICIIFSSKYIAHFTCPFFLMDFIFIHLFQCYKGLVSLQSPTHTSCLWSIDASNVILCCKIIYLQRFPRENSP